MEVADPIFGSDRYWGSYNNWEMKLLPLHCKRVDLRAAWMTTWNGCPIKEFSITTFMLNTLTLEKICVFHLFFVKFLSLTVLVGNPFAPHQVSSLGLGSSMSNTSLLNGSDTWVRKWTSGTANNHSWRSLSSFTTCLQNSWMDSPRFLKEKCKALNCYTYLE